MISAPETRSGMTFKTPSGSMGGSVRTPSCRSGAPAVMALIEPQLRIAEAAREWAATRPKGGTAAVAIDGTFYTVATREQVAAQSALLAAVDAEQAGGES